MNDLAGMHLFCFLALLISEAITSVNKTAFMHNFLLMATVPAYQFAIFKAYYNITLQEKIAANI